MKKVLLLMLIILGSLPTGVWAQRIIYVDAQLQNKDEKGKLLGAPVQTEATIYGFFRKSDATRVLDHLEADVAYMPEEDRNLMGLVKAETENGRATMTGLPASGWLVVITKIGDKSAEPVAANKSQITVTIIHRKAKTMGEVLAKGTRAPVSRPEPIKWLGNRIDQTFSYTIPEELASTTSRMVLTPVVNVIDTASYDDEKNFYGEALAHPMPAVKDGKEYHETQLRRMGFDLNHDPFYAAGCVSNEYMQTRVAVPLKTHIYVKPIDPRTHIYPIYAYVWAEDYNGVYWKQDSVLLSDGFFKNPLRFLQFNVQATELHRERYMIAGEVTEYKDKKELHLNFDIGKAEINMADSINAQQVNDVKRTISEYGDLVTWCKVKGYASPDGNYAGNKALSERRAAYLRHLIVGENPNVAGLFQVEPSEVVSWDTVCSILARENRVEEAEQLRKIAAGRQNVSGASLRALPFYNHLDTILQRLRKVEFEFGYVVARIKDESEIISQYNNDVDFREGRKAIAPYEYIPLFEYLKERPRELKVLAQKAYDNVRDPKRKERVWPMAAYYLAKANLALGISDPKVLNPRIYLPSDSVKLFYDFTKNEPYQLDYEERDFESQVSKGWINDESLVSLQVATYVNDLDYEMADSLARNLLNTKKPAFRPISMFLNCLNGGYAVDSIRTYVARTSTLNHAVVLAANVDDPLLVDSALHVIQDSLPDNMFEAKYMQATLVFVKENNLERKTYPNQYWEEPQPEDAEDGIERNGWYMVMAAVIDEGRALNTLRTDGYFTKYYRKAFRKYWKENRERILANPPKFKEFKPKPKPEEKLDDLDLENLD